ncbi:GDSL family lipase [Parafrankia colletiae]|uniref:GDSL family lipase n=1 Tax=Parafrankia colletiae TaxID=573497 RepID=A0A1S1RL84_9ACTN|nr:SGNH/GDSL hydrolase family protein [Parafrankia colletiae]MCK9902443.1 SGNH/GDSL hydrolase family protein [Frankia sp. Cpl3]OHV46175.1 GDSL family lipase [Parafrankia colletiae]
MDHSTPEAIRFVALGDSLTAGLGDGVSMGRDRTPAALAGRGFAALLAATLAPPGHVHYENLARTGATAREVRVRQLPVALALRPALACVVAGMNDVFKPAFDPLRLRQDLVWSIGRLRSDGAVVLTARLPDPGGLLPLPGPLGRLLTERVGHLNAAVDAAAARDKGVLVVDLGRHPAVRRRSTFDVDRVHPGPHGHRLIARAFADRLRESGMVLADIPEPRHEPPPPGTFDHLRWVATIGVPWLAGRPQALRGAPPRRNTGFRRLGTASGR